MRNLRLLVAIPAVVFLMSSLAFGSVPPMISYQGKLMQPTGAPVTDGTYSMRFAIYDVPTDGTALWSEPNPAVQVKAGLFSVLLGSVVNMPGNIFDGADRFFGIKVGSDDEMTPRQRIGSVAFSQVAGTVTDGAITTGKLADGAVTTAKLGPDARLPAGIILMWSGSISGIPQGWALCNGANGTPNLMDKFIVGAGSGYAVNATGGEAFHTLTKAEMPSHTHTTTRDLASNRGGQQQENQGPNGYAAHWFWPDACLSYEGGDQPHENRPPYYALCYIMKLP